MIQAGEFPSVPVLPYPDESAVVLPEPSSSFQYPTRPSLMMRLLKVEPLVANVWLEGELNNTLPELWLNVPAV